MHIDFDNSDVQSATSNVPKCKNCTLEEAAILNAIKDNPKITQQELAEKIEKSVRTIKTRTVEMQEKGIIQRKNGKRNGEWQILIEY